jgi:hypothetical protein
LFKGISVVVTHHAERSGFSVSIIYAGADTATRCDCVLRVCGHVRAMVDDFLQIIGVEEGRCGRGVIGR